MTLVAGVLRRAGDASTVLMGMLQRSGRDVISWQRHESSPQLALGVFPDNSLPEDKFDTQPLSNFRYTLVGDIRIDNRAELSVKLGLPAAQAAQMADSDLFLQAWTRWEAACVDHLIGGFAVAVWDRQTQELTLVRDHCGERPFYYAGNGDTFAFASVPRALRNLPGIDTQLNQDHLLHYLAIGPDSTASTYFKNILLLRPGHIVTWRNHQTAVRRYWHPADAAPVRFSTDEQYVERLLELFDAAVRARLRTTGNIGSQLSGGMDSSSVTAAAAYLLNPTALTAFTAIPQSTFTDLNPLGRFGNEWPAAASVAAMYSNIEHIAVEPSDRNMIQVIEETGRYTDTPVFNPMNQMWSNAILDEARKRGITVILQGTCGNATVSFGGMTALSDIFKSGKWLTLLRLITALRSKGHTSWRGAAYWAGSSFLPQQAKNYLRSDQRSFTFAFSPAHPQMAKEHKLAERAFEDFYGSDRSSEVFRRKMFDYFDTGFTNGGATVGWDISMRDPMQDKRVFEYCLSIPVEQYLAGAQSRSLVRRSMRNRLPPAVLACTTRGLQGADWYLTMGNCRPEMMAELDRIETSPLATTLLDLPRLRHLLHTWPDSGFEQPSVIDSWHLALSRGLALGNFIRHYENV